jgi:endonuclease-3
MARKSPRSRKKRTPAPRVPRTQRARATPRTRGASARARASSRSTPRAAHPAKRTRRPARAGARALVRRPRPALARKRPSRFAPPDPARVEAILGILDRTYPEARTALNFQNPLQLLVATILSAQCTDERVNQVTPALFARYPDAAALAGARREDLEAMIRSTGFFRNKTRAIQACCSDIVSKHGGEVPRTLEELTALHGVGRKTANVVLGNAFGIPGIVVDTHVSRLARRLGLTRELDPVKIEFALMPLIPRDRWTVFSHWLILHGRQVCVARKPRCSICPLAPHCPRIGVTAAN